MEKSYYVGIKIGSLLTKNVLKKSFHVKGIDKITKNCYVEIAIGIINNKQVLVQ